MYDHPFSNVSLGHSHQSSNHGSTTVRGQILIISIPELAFHHHNLATLGSASNRLSFPNLVALSLYPRVLAIYDSDPAGNLARAYLTQYPCVTLLALPNKSTLRRHRVPGDSIRRFLPWEEQGING